MRENPLEYNFNFSIFFSFLSQRQIFLIGNPIVYWLGVLSLLAYSALLLLYLIRRKRSCFDLTEGKDGFIFMVKLKIGIRQGFRSTKQQYGYLRIFFVFLFETPRKLTLK